MNDAGSVLPELRPATSPRNLGLAAVEALCEASVSNADRFDGLIGLSTLAVPVDRHAVFLDAFDEERLPHIEAAAPHILFVLPEGYRGKVGHAALFVPHVRESFSRLAEELFDYAGDYWTGYDASVQAQVRMPAARIMPGSQIHRSATIGEGTLVLPGNVIGPQVVIGRNCLIRPQSAIGFSGYGIFVGPDGRNRHLPHVGGVVIGDEVEIGSFTTVCSGTIHPTVVEDTAKIDDHVHIAHNCRIRFGAKVIAHAEVSGSVEVGANAWIAPNVSILEGVRIGAGAFVGIGSNVVKDVPEGMLVVGNPARVLRPVKDAAKPDVPNA